VFRQPMPDESGDRYLNRHWSDAARRSMRVSAALGVLATLIMTEILSSASSSHKRQRFETFGHVWLKNSVNSSAMAF
jgi:hypothetical protein